MRFETKLHGNRKLHEAKPSAILTVVSANFHQNCTLFDGINHDLPSLTPSGHYCTI